MILAGPARGGQEPSDERVGDRSAQAWLQRVCTAARVLTDLQASRGDGTYRRRLRLLQVDVLALDDVGLRPLTTELAEDLYELIRERYERKPLLLTSNRALAEWPEAFGNPLLANAALGRLTHHCQTVVIRGESYRQRGRKQNRRRVRHTKRGGARTQLSGLHQHASGWPT
ncbi:MAG: ATP-binding protein [Chloroflexota bacterium]